MVWVCKNDVEYSINELFLWFTHQPYNIVDIIDNILVHDIWIDVFYKRLYMSILGSSLVL